MKDSSKDLNRIPKEQLTAYERWELPTLDARGNEVVREEELSVKPLTAGDIAEIRQAAQEDGRAEGREQGLKEGHAEGYEQGHKEGLEAGLAEGQERGRSEGYEETQATVNANQERLEQLLGELLLPISQHQDELETSLVNLTMVLARAVVYRELTIDSSQIRQVVRRAVEALPSTAENIRIHVHPDDVSVVRDVAERLEATASVIEDDDVLPGGCRVQSRNSLVDFTVEKRFQRAVQTMLEQQAGDSDHSESDDLAPQMDDLTDFHRDVLSAPGSDQAEKDDAESSASLDNPSEDNPAEGERNDDLPG